MEGNWQWKVGVFGPPPSYDMHKSLWIGLTRHTDNSLDPAVSFLFLFYFTTNYIHNRVDRSGTATHIIMSWKE